MDLRIKTFDEYQKAYDESQNDRSGFWSNIAEQFSWKKKWTNVFSSDFETPDIKWFENGKFNITENLLDRHVKNHPNKVAFYWEPNDNSISETSITYKELYEKVCKLANGLRSIGVKKGDRVCIYMPMVLESVVSILACARIGAVHSIVFAGFSSKALADRIIDAQAKTIITTSESKRGSKRINLKRIVDESIKDLDFIQNVITFNNNQSDFIKTNDFDLDYDELINEQSKECAAELMDSEDILFILYTSGSTGKPKGIVHSCGGYMIYTAYSFQNVFQYEKDDVFWCTADIGWITGHSYIIYGPLLSGATSVMFEGTPTFPHVGRFWEVCEKYKVNQFYTAPTAIRALMCHGTEPINKFNLNSLKVIGSVGEPINEEAWQWYNDNIGKNNCPIVDTWWQTETGGIMLSGLGGLSPQKPTHAGLPLPGIDPILVNKEGEIIKENNTEGYLCIQSPWPSMLRTVYNDHQRCKNVYFSNYKNLYFTGDGAKRDENGLYRIIGRVDDVINVSGHRFGTAEIEDSIDANSLAIEAAVVGYPHEVKGQAIYAYVVVDTKTELSETEIIKSLENSVLSDIGNIARPEKIQIVSDLPKTRSGKIMRRILRKIAEGERSNFGDTSTLLNPEIVEQIVLKVKLDK